VHCADAIFPDQLFQHLRRRTMEEVQSAFGLPQFLRQLVQRLQQKVEGTLAAVGMGVDLTGIKDEGRNDRLRLLERSQQPGVVGHPKVPTKEKQSPHAAS
jgi:hypothetical protein